MKNKIYIILVLLFAVTTVTSQPKKDDLHLSGRFQPISPNNIFKTEGYYNWGASILKDKQGTYHLFYSRWKKEYGFYGWLTHSTIAHATSKKASGPWEYKETALKGTRKNRWDAITAHNPKIKCFDGKYYLYYISTNMGNDSISEQELIETAKTGYKHPHWNILRSNQRTGVAVSNSMRGPWKRMEAPLIHPTGPITTLTVNPAIDKDGKGTYYLIVKGDKPYEKAFIRNQAVAVSTSPLGPFEMQEKPVIDYMDTEDMSIWFDETRERFYGVFHAHKFIGMLTSTDGINWKKANNSILMRKEILLEGGSKLIPNRLERPFIYHENGKPKVLSLAVKKGDSSYSIYIPIKVIKNFPNQKN